MRRRVVGKILRTKRGIKRSTVHFLPVYAVGGYGFRMVVDVIENSIFPDSKPVSFGALELLGFVLSGLLGTRADVKSVN